MSTENEDEDCGSLPQLQKKRGCSAPLSRDFGAYVTPRHRHRTGGIGTHPLPPGAAAWLDALEEVAAVVGGPHFAVLAY